MDFGLHYHYIVYSPYFIVLPNYKKNRYHFTRGYLYIVIVMLIVSLCLFYFGFKLVFMQ
jgi:hypothetical protein